MFHIEIVNVFIYNVYLGYYVNLNLTERDLRICVE